MAEPAGGLEVSVTDLDDPHQYRLDNPKIKGRRMDSQEVIDNAMQATREAKQVTDQATEALKSLNSQLSVERIKYLTDIYKIYVSHLNSVFNFFIVFSGLALSGLALIIREEMHTSTNIDEAFIGMGMAMTAIMLLLDQRSRYYIEHLEKQMKVQEECLFGEEGIAYLHNKTDPTDFYRKIPNGILFPVAYALFFVFLCVLIFIL